MGGVDNLAPRQEKIHVKHDEFFILDIFSEMTLIFTKRKRLQKIRIIAIVRDVRKMIVLKITLCGWLIDKLVLLIMIVQKDDT